MEENEKFEDKLYSETEIKSFNEAEKTVEVIISDSSVDRDYEVVDPKACEKAFEEFMKHPVLCDSHNRWETGDQIGKVLELKRKGQKIWAKVQYFVDKGNPKADWAWFLVTQKIAAYSIGFRVKDYKRSSQPDVDGYRVKFTEIELIELSQVIVPSNRNAIQRSLQEAELATKALDLFNNKDKAEQIKSFCESMVKEKSIPEEKENSENEFIQDQIKALNIIKDELQGLVKSLKPAEENKQKHYSGIEKKEEQAEEDENSRSKLTVSEIISKLKE